MWGANTRFVCNYENLAPVAGVRGDKNLAYPPPQSLCTQRLQSGPAQPSGAMLQVRIILRRFFIRFVFYSLRIVRV